MTSTLVDNPVLAPWSGPHGGGPAFDAIRVEHFVPALDEAMGRYRAEVAAIAANPAPPTFANTLEAMERSGRAFRQATSLMGTFTSTMNSAEMQAVQRQMAPKLAAFRDEIMHNRPLFDRIRAVYDARETSGLDAEQQRLADVVWRRFTRQGAALGDADKHRLAEINQRLASLHTAFSQNILADEEGLALVLDNEADLDGLPSNLVEAAAAAAEQRGLKGQWVIANTRSSMDPFITLSTRRDLREKALLRKVWTPAAARAREEIAEMAPIVAAEGSNEPLEAWDYRYYAEKLRKAKYDLSDDEVKPYLQLSRLRDGMFWAAGELFGLKFTNVTDMPVYHPDVEVFEVTRDGALVGLWYFDLYARPGKSSGAWMSEYRTQQTLAGVTPIISNNSNFMKAAPGEPVLISWTDAVTLFHEFGHGLHGLNSAVTYPSLAGTSVVRDFVELPSQLNERWLPTPELLQRFAVHYETGEPMPAMLTDKVLAAQNFRQGFNTTEYLACAILDLEAHLGADEALDAREFEREALERLGMPKEIILRHRLPHFSHVFSGESYAAGYYNYIWADVLSADAAEAFAEAPGGFYDKDLAKRLLDEVLSIGNSVEAGEAYRRFRGRDYGTGALMRSRGFEAVSEEV
jgi:peptidyl-dipeptidase Dcp